MVDPVPPSSEAARESESGGASPEQALTKSTPARNLNQMANVEVSRSFLPAAELRTWSDAHFHPRRRMASHLGSPRNFLRAARQGNRAQSNAAMGESSDQRLDYCLLTGCD